MLKLLLRLLDPGFELARRFSHDDFFKRSKFAHCDSFVQVAFNHAILISFSTDLNSWSAVTSSAFLLLASAAAKASARPKPWAFFKSAAASARSRSTGTASNGVVRSNWRAVS